MRNCTRSPAIWPLFGLALLACTGASAPEAAQEAGGREEASLPIPEGEGAGGESGAEAGRDASETGRADASSTDASEGAMVRDAGADIEVDAGLVSCDRRTLTCKRAAPSCAEFEAPIIVDGCYGACVRIDRCACDGPEACPDEERFTCHRYAAHCGPYVR